MRSDVVALTCALSILLSSCATHSMSRAEKRANENEARTAARHWLQLLDDGDYEEAFEFEAQDFRMYRTQSQFVRLMQGGARHSEMLCREILLAQRTWKNSWARRRAITKVFFSKPLSNVRTQPPSGSS